MLGNHKGTDEEKIKAKVDYNIKEWFTNDSIFDRDKLEKELWDIPHSCPVKAQERVLEFFQKHL